MVVSQAIFIRDFGPQILQSWSLNLSNSDGAESMHVKGQAAIYRLLPFAGYAGSRALNFSCYSWLYRMYA